MVQEVDNSVTSVPNLNNIKYIPHRGTAVASGDLITSINASAEGVSIRGDKINFNTSNFVIKDTSNNIMF
jgi:hypothetical protein